MNDKGQYFKFFPGDEFFSPHRSDYSEEQWSWYFHLKGRAWLNEEERGCLPFKESALIKMAAANTQKDTFTEMWKAFLKTLVIDDGKVIFPDLIENSKRINRESNQNAVAGSISH